MMTLNTVEIDVHTIRFLILAAMNRHFRIDEST